MGSSEFYCEQGLLAIFLSILILVYCGKIMKLAPGFNIPMYSQGAFLICVPGTVDSQGLTALHSHCPWEEVF